MGYYVHEAPKAGEVYKSITSGDYVILEYINSRKVLIEFLQTKHKMFAHCSCIRSGRIWDPYSPRTYGNYMGEGPYNEGNTPIVSHRWKGVHERVGKSNGVLSVDASWLCYQDFYSWSEKQIGHNMKGYEIDRDLLFVGNTHYGPDTCCYLPSKINSLKFNRTTKESGLVMGVSICKLTGLFRARWRDENGKQNEVRLKTLEEAIEAVNTAKKIAITNLAYQYKESIDPRAYEALINWDVNERTLDKSFVSLYSISQGS